MSHIRIKLQFPKSSHNLIVYKGSSLTDQIMKFIDKKSGTLILVYKEKVIISSIYTPAQLDICEDDAIEAFYCVFEHTSKEVNKFLFLPADTATALSIRLLRSIL